MMYTNKTVWLTCRCVKFSGKFCSWKLENAKSLSKDLDLHGSGFIITSKAITHGSGSGISVKNIFQTNSKNSKNISGQLEVLKS